LGLEIKNSVKLFSQLSYPIVYQGTVNLIKAKALKMEEMPSKSVAYLQALAKDPYNGWKAVLPHIAVSTVPGTHYELFSSGYLATTAEALQKMLRSVVVEKVPSLDPA
jgi:hypothetical protein